QQRLAGARLPGPGTEARLQLDADVLDQSQVLHEQFAKHRPGPVSRPKQLQYTRAARGNQPEPPRWEKGYDRARSRPSALWSVSAYSASGVESATMPPPTGNCTQPRPAVKVRMSKLVSMLPSKPM